MVTYIYIYIYVCVCLYVYNEKVEKLLGPGRESMRKKLGHSRSGLPFLLMRSQKNQAAMTKPKLLTGTSHVFLKTSYQRNKPPRKPLLFFTTLFTK